MEGSWPNLFLVGAPRCATTSLFAYLSAHPDVFGAGEKEPHFYDRDVMGPGGLTRAEYAALFAGATSERWLLEASALYLYSQDAPAAIDRESPGAHILVALRDPVELVASWHALMLASGSEIIADLGEAIAAEPRRRLGLDVPANTLPSLLLYTELGRFARHVDRWRGVFGGDRVHLVLRDELESDPRATCARLLDALALEHVDGLEVPHLNPARRTNGAAVLAALNRPGAVRSVLRAVLPHPVRRYAWHRVTHALTPVGERPPVDPALRGELEPLFAGELELLASSQGRGLAWRASDSTA